MNTVLERATQVVKNASILYGQVEQASTPHDLIVEMVSEVPLHLIKNHPVKDSYCGRGSILAEVVLKKLSLVATSNTDDQKLLNNIVSNEIYGNDLDSAFADMARSTMRRLTQNQSTINVDNQDALLYNSTMNTNNFISITNPPYQPPRGVKKGGNFYKPHVLSEINNCPLFGVTNIPMTFMVQDPLDEENKAFRTQLLDAGLKKIKHVRSGAYSANVLTIYAVWEKDYTGPVEFQTYDVVDPTVYHKLMVPRAQLYKMNIWPVARTQQEFALANTVLSYVKKKYSYIKNKVKDKQNWCVEYEYLIGMEKERLNKMNPLRGVAKRGPTDTVRGGSLSKFINVEDSAEADSLVDFLSTVGQEWFRTIPRGSSAENWMVGPLIEMWKDLNKKDKFFEANK
jgi:predicted RNA methylase